MPVFDVEGCVQLSLHPIQRPFLEGVCLDILRQRRSENQLAQFLAFAVFEVGVFGDLPVLERFGFQRRFVPRAERLHLRPQVGDLAAVFIGGFLDPGQLKGALAHLVDLYRDLI